MSIKNLDKIFQPRSIAVIGASATASKVGHAVLRNLLDGGYPHPIFPINPRHGQIGGLTTYPSVGDLPQPVDLALICTPAASVPEIVDACGKHGVGGLAILSAGFRERGEDGELLERALARRSAAHPQMRIIGPNCLGFISPYARLNASFARGMPTMGRVAFLSQSGALCTSVLDWANQERVGFSHFVSVGNMLNVGMGDLIDYLAADENTESIILYVESITDPREFMSAARAFTRNKPIIAYKAGRFAESAAAAASHTGAMAGVDSVYEAALARAGVVRVYAIDEIFDCAELLARQSDVTCGRRLAIVTNAGGPGVMATDALLEKNGLLAKLSAATIQRLNKELPPAWSRGNPVDILGDATPDRLRRAIDIVIQDDGVDALLVIQSPQMMTDPLESARAVVDARQHTTKPLLTSWMGARSMCEAVELLNENHIPTYSTPEKAVAAFMYLVSYSRNREILYETPREIPMEFALDRSKLRAVFHTILSEGRDILNESTSKALLEAYEIPVSQTWVARSKEDAVQYATRIGYPVVLKVFSPDITHKTDVGGVALNITSDDEVMKTFEALTAAAKSLRPDANVEGVTVQQMVSVAAGREMIVGAKRDPVFGVVLLVGMGGTTAELFRDLALELPPVSERLARRMLESLRAWPLLNGFRGRPAVDLDRLIEAIMRLSYLVADYPEILELDVNPLLATPSGVIALDARIALDHQAVLHPTKPYSHLAIRPYPEEFVKKVELSDGQLVVLRPIKPEDEPLWHALVASCSPETLRMRFRYMFQSTTHEMATRFCFLDYEREIAIVAEIGTNHNRKFVGVGRLVSDADHREAEFAIIVSDAWQGSGLGSILTDHCLQICSQWGIQSVMAETSPENMRMISMFKNRGFKLDRKVAADVVIARKQIVD